MLSLGYDTVGGRPARLLELLAARVPRIGGLLATSGLPVCVVQEGGYALETLAECGYAFASGLLDGGEPA